METASRVRPGDYRDSIQLLQLQSGLEELPGIVEAAAVMATPGNLELLRSSGWALPPAKLGPNDLVAAVRAESRERAEQALDQIDGLLSRRASATESEYRPRSLEAALIQLPEAAWVLISVPGEHAAELARKALRLGRNVFLFSDNVRLDDEVSLKREACKKGLLLMGPDCGTAIVNGVGLGFANQVRRGSIGLVGSSGTGLQAVCCHIHALGGGISHALGVGGRDLSEAVGAVSTRQALDLLRRDPGTEVIGLVSKSPELQTVGLLAEAARHFPKPVAACFLGSAAPARRLGSLHFVRNLVELAELVLELRGHKPQEQPAPAPAPPSPRRWLRGVFGGGTLAGEALHRLRMSLRPLYSNLHSDGVLPLQDPRRSRAHTVVDLGDDVFTRGKPHPMMEPDLLRRRLEEEAADPETALILFDVVLGHGAHPSPASVLAPLVARHSGRGLQFVALVVGADEDPQDASAQARLLAEAGTLTCRSLDEALEAVELRLGGPVPEVGVAVPLEAISNPFAAVSAGLEVFAQSAAAQGAQVLHMDWRPPAGGDRDLAALLERMRKK